MADRPDVGGGKEAKMGKSRRLLIRPAAAVAASCLGVLVWSAAWAAAPSVDRTPPVLEIKPPDRDRPPAKLPANMQETVEPAPFRERIVVPIDLPGADAGELPKLDPANPKAYLDALDILLPPLPPAAAAMAAELGPDGRPLALDDLQRIALSSSPVIRQAHAAVDAACGAARQAGLYPNPILGFQSDNFKQNNTAGQIGGFFNIELVHLAKLRLARAIAASDERLTRIALSNIEAEVIAGVRHGYFAVLAAQESVRVQEALTRLTDEAYRLQVERLKETRTQPYEAVQLRALAFQARGRLVQARNKYLSAWKQLAATTGRFEMPPTILDGRIDRPLPVIDFEAAQKCVVSRHTDLAAAQTLVEKAQAELRLAEANRVPNVQVYSVVQKDYTWGLDNTTANLRVGVPVPIFNMNRGAIARARAELARAQEEASRVQASLTGQLAEAYERYDTNRRLIVYYRDNIMPDQVRAYRAIHARRQHVLQPASFGDLVSAQQTLAASVTVYQQTLEGAWAAVVDIAKLMQARDLEVGLQSCSTRLSCLSELPSVQAGSATLNWPEVMPDGSAPRQMPSVLPCPTCPDLPPPRATPQPVSDPVIVAPLGSIERSTRRRRFFGPTFRPGGDIPSTLPPVGDPSCCPPSSLAPEPKSLPKVLPNVAPQPLPKRLEPDSRKRIEPEIIFLQPPEPPPPSVAAVPGLRISRPK